MTDRGMSDDKLICSDHPPSPAEYRNVLRFFHFYAKENDEGLKLRVAQVFIVELHRDPWIAVWCRRVTTRPR